MPAADFKHTPSLLIDIADFTPSYHGVEREAALHRQLQTILTAGASFFMPYGDVWAKWKRRTGGYYFLFDTVRPQVALEYALRIGEELVAFNDGHPKLRIWLRMVLAVGDVEEPSSDAFSAAELISTPRLEELCRRHPEPAPLAATDLFHLELVKDLRQGYLFERLSSLSWTRFETVDQHGQPHAGHLLKSTPAPSPDQCLILERLELRNFKNIEHLEIDFRVRSSLGGAWTCLAGINGSGKTSILQAISVLLLGRRRATELGEERLRQMLRRSDGERFDAELSATISEGPNHHTLYLPISEHGIDEEKLRKHPDADAMEELWRRLGAQLLVSYGATRNLSYHRDTRYADSSREVQRQMTLFDPLTQIAAVDVLLQGGEFARPILRTLKGLLERVLQDNELGLTVDLGRDRVVFRAQGAELEAIDLPDGFRALVAWLADLCTAWHQTVSGNGAVSFSPDEITGIVLLDEIDLHLHPALQRSLVPRLRAALPNIQWVVTTHSPLVLSSFDRNELVLLDPGSEGGIRRLDRQILGFSSDQVYRWLMDTSPHSSVIETKLGQGDDRDVAVLLYQSEERDEAEAEQALDRRRERIARLRQRKEQA